VCSRPRRRRVRLFAHIRPGGETHTAKPTAYNQRRTWLEALESRTLLSSGVGFFNPNNTTWALRSTASPGGPDVGRFRFGIAVPIVGDWNGDGVDGIGAYRPRTATWHLRQIASAGAADVGTFILVEGARRPSSAISWTSRRPRTPWPRSPSSRSTSTCSG
jgi:hypothetical protein